jgi:arylsulfatase A
MYFTLRIVACCSLVMLFARHMMAADSPPRPNFLVILCDDLGYGDLGCFGHPRIKTPHLDELAGEGVKLTSCYASAPVCSASRAGLLTGRTPTRIGVYDWIPPNHPMHLSRKEISVATLLKRAGYSTCHVGKWHLNGKFNDAAQPQPGDHGFDHWMSTQNNAGPSHENPRNFVRNGKAVGELEGFSCQLVADEAMQWLEKGRTQERPFFQFVCFHEPHEPIASPVKLVEQYSDVSPADKAQHHANVTNVDLAVGRLLTKLDELKLADNTVVFFTSDNGPETLNRYRTANRSYGSPGDLKAMKLWLYEGGIRVPGILRWPKSKLHAKVIDEPISNVDILPTFCELAGAKLPDDRAYDGASFAGLLRGEAHVKRMTPLYWHYVHALGEPRAALREGDWMILGKWKAGTPKTIAAAKQEKLVDFELYNLRDDVAQTKDLAAQDSERMKELAAQPVKKYEEVQAAAPTWEQPAKEK